MIPNYFNKEDWFKIITKTLICAGYKPDLKLDEKAWQPLFDLKIHPLQAIRESEGIFPIVCYHNVRKEVING